MTVLSVPLSELSVPLSERTLHIVNKQCDNFVVCNTAKQSRLKQSKTAAFAVHHPYRGSDRAEVLKLPPQIPLLAQR